MAKRSRKQVKSKNEKHKGCGIFTSYCLPTKDMASKALTQHGIVGSLSRKKLEVQNETSRLSEAAPFIRSDTDLP